MKRLYFRGEAAGRAADILFGGRPDYRRSAYTRYPELELVWQEDGRFSVWGNADEEHADLLQDTRRDPKGLVEQVRPLAAELLDDDGLPDPDDGFQEE